MSNREKLFELEASGNHVFHGSDNGNIETMEPRQGTHVVDTSNPEESSILDGNPAVAATPHAELAIFRAIINGRNIPFPHVTGFGTTKNGEKHFSISDEKILEAVKDKKGYVYVFDKKDFKPYDRNIPENPRPQSMEWRSDQPVKPLDVIEVTSDDLPSRDRIKVRSSEE